MKILKVLLMCGILLTLIFALQRVAFAQEVDNVQIDALNSLDRTIEDGTYVIKSALNENYVLDVAGGSTVNWANIQLLKSNGMNNQKFNVKYLGDGYYQIIAVHSGKSLDVKDAKIANCT
ncbi:MAG: RICIN domain-containing protein, partial [Clostridia bacterium]